MDSTLINIECVDEIADAGFEVAEITEADGGEIADYSDSLRYALLASRCAGEVLERQAAPHPRRRPVDARRPA